MLVIDLDEAPTINTPRVRRTIPLAVYVANFTNPRTRMTRWTNPTRKAVKIATPLGPLSILPEELNVPELRAIASRWRAQQNIGEALAPATLVIEWQPGETLDVPSEFDRAMHVVHTDEDGKRTIMAGLAPQLVREGQSYDVHRAIRDAAESSGSFDPLESAAPVVPIKKVSSGKR